MSFLGIGNKTSILPQKKESKPLPNRFMDRGGFMQCGATKHEPRTNSAEEIKDSIELKLKNYEKRVEADKENGADSRKQLIDNCNLQGVKDFIAKMKDMPQKHLSVAHDILDLDNMCAFINHDIFPEINLSGLGQDSTGKQSTLLQYVLDKLPQISKENPAVLNLLDTVFSNSDPANAKYFINKLITNVDAFKGCEKQIEAAEDFVPAFAESFLKGMPSMYLDNDCKENQFYTAVASLCNPDTKPENLKLFQKALQISDECDTNSTFNTHFDIGTMRKGDTERIKENMKHLPELLKNAVKQNVDEIDVSGFLENNINLD